MSVRMIIEVSNASGAQTVLQALDSYKQRLRAGIERTRQRLTTFEVRYGVDTGHFLHQMTAEELGGGDLEYVEWAGEARLLEQLQVELLGLEDARCQYSQPPSHIL